ncbi:hypothetical protein EAF00_001179 [Botryotinia globosa]|nr:hypothetical protein EAF00_001179 [Botryotinia globosa]
MPFPSRGCHTCKKRRVKCDEIKPSCNHCIRAKISCLGYSGIEKYEFLNENEAVSGKIKRPRGPNMRRSIQLHSPFQSPAPKEHKRCVNRTIDEANLIKLSSIPHVTVLFSSPRPPPTTPLQDQAIAYYTRQFVEAPEEVTPQFSASHDQQFARILLGLLHHRNEHLIPDLPAPHYNSLFLRLPTRLSGDQQRMLLLYQLGVEYTAKPWRRRT